MQSPFRLMHRWIWRDPHRRAHKLLRFAETEANGGRDLVRAAERTADPLLRRLYLTHADDEQRHANLFRHRGIALLSALPASPSKNFQANWFAPGERGLDDLRVEREPDEALLAFLHLSEKVAAERFALYRDVLANDPPTRELFAEVLRDRDLPYEIHVIAAEPPLPRAKPLASVARPSWSSMERISPDRRGAGRCPRYGVSDHTIFRVPAPLCVAGKARGASGEARLEADFRQAQRALEQRILR